MCETFRKEKRRYQIDEKRSYLRVSPWLSGFVCAFHPAVPGLSPKHTINDFILNFVMWKRRKFITIEAGIGAFLKTVSHHENVERSEEMERSTQSSLEYCQ